MEFTPTYPKTVEGIYDAQRSNSRNPLLEYPPHTTPIYYRRTSLSSLFTPKTVKQFHDAQHSNFPKPLLAQSWISPTTPNTPTPETLLA
jgi:hypothetical protein